jgi:hypothetical protein
MITYTTAVSQNELDLIDAMQRLRFGEILDVFVEDQPEGLTARITEQQRALIQLIRSGAQEFDAIVVAEGNPITATASCQIGRHRCRKKNKF